LVGVVPGIAGEPVFCGPGDVGGKDEAVPIDDGIEARSGAEAFGVLDGPSGKDAATAPASDKEIVGIDVAFSDDGVDAAVEVGEIVSWIGVMDEIGEFLAVAGAAAGVGVEDDVAWKPRPVFRSRNDRRSRRRGRRESRG